jgi:hypothetical protein
MKFIASHDKHERLQRKGAFSFWKFKCVFKKQGILAMEGTSQLRASRKALTCLIYALARARTLKGLEIWAQRKMFRRRFAFWRFLCFAENLPWTMNSADLLIAKRNRLLKLHSIAKMMKHLHVSRACTASGLFIKQKHQLFSKQCLIIWQSRILKLARSGRVSTVMSRRHSLLVLSVSFSTWVRSSKRSRWFRRCYSTVKFKQVLFLLEICCHGWRLVALNKSRSKRIYSRIQKLTVMGRVRSAIQVWCCLIESKKERLAECIDAERICRERRRRGMFVVWAATTTRSRTGRVAENRSIRRRVLSRMSLVFEEWVYQYRFWRRISRIIASKSQFLKVAHSNRFLHLWYRWVREHKAGSHRVSRAAASRYTKIKADHIQAWRLFARLTKAAMSLYAGSTAHLLTVLIHAWENVVRRRKALISKTLVCAFRFQTAVMTKFIRIWKLYSIVKTKMFRTAQTIRRRMLGQAIAFSMSGWLAFHKRQRYLKRCLLAQLSNKSTVKKSLCLQAWSSTTRFSMDMSKSHRLCQSRYLLFFY